MGAGLEGLKEVPCSSNTEAPGPDSQKEWAARRQASFLLCVRLLHLRDRDSLMRLLCSQLPAPGGEHHPAIGHENWGTVRDFVSFREVQCPFLGESRECMTSTSTTW